MSHYYKDVINSLSNHLDTINDQLIREQQNEQPNVFEQNEMDTCDTDGGPWFEDFKRRGNLDER
jgi:hypothetical protein